MWTCNPIFMKLVISVRGGLWGVPEPANPDKNSKNPKNPQVEKKPQPETAKLNKGLQFSSVSFEYFQNGPFH